MAYRDVILADNPSAYWRLNEPSGTTAVDLVGAKNGTISGGVTLNQPGALADGDKAMTFDGTTGVIGLAAFVVVGTTCTIEFWIRRPTNWVTGYNGIVGAAAGGVSVYGSNNKINCFGAGDNFNLTTLALNTTYHVVIAISAGNGTFYVNGLADGTFTGWPGNNFNSLMRCSGFLAGTLDEVAIYPVALTAAQIAAHYAAATSGARPISWGLYANGFAA